MKGAAVLLGVFALTTLTGVSVAAGMEPLTAEEMDEVTAHGTFSASGVHAETAEPAAVRVMDHTRAKLTVSGDAQSRLRAFVVNNVTGNNQNASAINIR